MRHSICSGMTVHGMHRVSHAMCEPAALQLDTCHWLHISKPCQNPPSTSDGPGITTAKSYTCCGMIANASMLIYALCSGTTSMRSHSHWGMSKSIPCWKKSSKGDTWQLMTGLPCKTALRRSLRQICVSSSGSARNPLSLRQLLSTASLGKPVPDSCLFTYSTIYGATQFCNSERCSNSFSAAALSKHACHQVLGSSQTGYIWPTV